MTKNDIRTNCMKGYSLRPKEFSEDLRELCFMKVYRRIGRGLHMYELTEFGHTIASMAYKIKPFLEVLDLPTTYNLGGQVWKNKWIDTS
jgi:hypothetical protein